MKIITRYLLEQFLRIFFLTLAVLTILFLVIHFMDRIDEFVRSENVSKVFLIVIYFLYKIPISVYTVTPMAILLASLLTLGVLYRNNEIVILKSCGLSLIRIAFPILAASLGIGVISFLNGEFVVVTAKKETNKIFYEDIRQVGEQAVFRKDRIWLRSDPNYVWNIRHLDTNRKTLNGITLYEVNEADGSIKSRLDADYAVFNEGGKGWWFQNAAYRQFDTNRNFTEKYFRRLWLNIDATVEDFLIAKKDPDEMTFREILEYIREIRKEGYDDTRYMVDMQVKIAFPAIGLVMALISVPFAETMKMRGGHLMGIGLAVIIGAVFWFIFSMAVALGHSGKLPSLLAAYGAHIIFGFTAVYMLLSNRQ